MRQEQEYLTREQAKILNNIYKSKLKKGVKKEEIINDTVEIFKTQFLHVSKRAVLDQLTSLLMENGFFTEGNDGY